VGVSRAQAVVQGTLVFVEMGPMVVVMGVFMVVVGVAVHGAIGVHVFMHMLMVMSVGVVVMVFVALDGGFTLAAAAYRAHVCFSENYSTNKSLTRISVPPVACTW
jgi:hypothetical protein